MTIALRNVTKTYHTGAGAGAVAAVAGVTLDVQSGEFLSVLGPSGCGKSTLLMMAAGLEPVSSGEISIDGETVTCPRRHFGLVFQDATLLPWLSAENNVLFPIKMMRMNPDAHRARARRLLAEVGLQDATERRPCELSGGMRQRVALCRSLIHEPTKIFMDEPFSALDAITRDEMGQVLLKLWDAHAALNAKTAIFVTHSIREAVLLSDRVVVMGRRPSVIKADVVIPFPRPRSLGLQEHPTFNQIVSDLRGHIDHSL